jgi:hypothetical protein
VNLETPGRPGADSDNASQIVKQRLTLDERVVIDFLLCFAWLAPRP